VAERRAAAPRSPRRPEGAPMHIRAVMGSCATVLTKLHRFVDKISYIFKQRYLKSEYDFFASAANPSWRLRVFYDRVIFMSPKIEKPIPVEPSKIPGAIASNKISNCPLLDLRNIGISAEQISFHVNSFVNYYFQLPNDSFKGIDRIQDIVKTYYIRNNSQDLMNMAMGSFYEWYCCMMVFIGDIRHTCGIHDEWESSALTEDSTLEDMVNELYQAYIETSEKHRLGQR
jgi:hypothetical protein